uniref:SphC n=1 Tax=Herpetosiphon sp. B060 TaxID=2002978 RepID=A0A2Z2H077_9CHLR|nr:SphC [Herpetosiphon sp. B060]
MVQQDLQSQSQNDLYTLFTNQARQTPQAEALRWCIDEQWQSLSFEQLAKHIEQLAAALAATGIGVGSVVGVLAERSPAIVTSILALFKLGAIYVPLDLGYSAANIAQISAQTAMALIITRHAYVAKIANVPINYADIEELIVRENPTPASVMPDPARPALLLYTSGTTGQPKGALHCQRQLLNRFNWLWQNYPFAAGDLMVQRTSINFMPSLWEWLGGLVCGVATLIIDDTTIKNPRRFLKTLAEQRATHLAAVPSLLGMFLEGGNIADLAGLRLLICGGEPLLPGLRSQLRANLPTTTILNDYGATEMNGVLFNEYQPQQPATETGMRPIANVEVLILDHDLNLITDGSSGQIYIGGPCLAYGYVNQANLTAERFIPHPAATLPGSRLYRTGDVGRQLADGSIVISGRQDHQVKIRGMRVELAGIEQTLAQHPEVRIAVVVAHEAKSGQKSLAGYVVTRGAITTAELHTYLTDNLPNYMVPAQLVILDEMPRLPNGKIDRMALTRRETVKSLTANSVIDQLCQIAATVLETDPTTLEPERKFYELGFDSVNVVSFVRAINQHLGCDIDVSAIYNYATLADLASALATIVPAQVPAPQPIAIEKHLESTSAVAPIQSTAKPLIVPTQPIAASSVIDQLCQIAAIVLETDPALLEPERKFYELGFDSVNVVSFVRLINQHLGCDIDVSAIYNYATLADLALALATEHGVILQQTSVAAPILKAPVAIPAAPVPTFNSPSIATTTPVESPQQPQIMTVADTAQGTEPTEVAIIGLAGRFPGAASVAEFWELLAAGQSAIREVPADRWSNQTYFDPNPQTPQHTTSKWGGFLDQIDYFDHSFFNISKSEAAGMDPQQRLCLEEGWKALEDAGYVEDAVAGKTVGVFVGMRPGDYLERIRSQANELTAYNLLGSDSAILAARLAYYLNLKGPSIAIDTACSSSLVAIHLACQSIRAGESELALAGGVSILSTPSLYITSSKMGMLSATGQCKTFDNQADGFVPGEAVGFVVLKALSQAQRDGDRIYGVIKGSGINQDGKTNGITAPSGQAQTTLERAVYAQAKLSPRSISYIEAHGTGTRLGDPIEIRALTESFRHWTEDRQFCAIGSVKTNMGHALAAAGIAGLAKVLLSLQQRQIPPSLNFVSPNEHIPFADSPFFVATQLQPWLTPAGEPRRAAISSFGFSGTNSHLVLEEFAQPRVDRPESQWHLIVLSAKTETALRQQIVALSQALEQPKQTYRLDDIAYTLLVRRAAFAVRCAMIVRDYSDLQHQLRLLQQPQTQFTKAPKAQPLHTTLTFQRSPDDLASLKECFLSNQVVDWQHLYPQTEHNLLSLPHYCFERERFWIDTDQPLATNQAPNTAQLHPLIEANCSTLQGIRFNTVLQPTDFYVADHRWEGQALLPGVVYAEIARVASSLALNQPVSHIEQLLWLRPLIVEQTINLQSRIYADEHDVLVEIGVADPADQLTIHAKARIPLAKQNVDSQYMAALDLPAIRAICVEQIDQAEFYQHFSQLGLNYGSRLQAIKSISYNAQQALAELELPTELSADFARYSLHPALLDAALQTVLVLQAKQAGRDKADLPFELAAIDLIQPLERQCVAYVQRNAEQGRLKRSQIVIANLQGEPLVVLHGFAQGAPKATTGNEVEALQRGEIAYYSATEYETALVQGSIAQGTMLVFGSSQVQKLLNSSGANVQVTYGTSYRQIDRYTYTIDWLNPNDYHQLFATLEREGLVPSSILQLANLETKQSSSLEQTVEATIYPLIYLYQALGMLKFMPNLRILWAWQEFVHNSSSAAAQAALSGVLQTLANEYPALPCKLVSFVQQTDLQLIVASLLNELQTTDFTFETINYVNQKRLSQGYQRQPASAEPTTTPFRSGGTYLITGGLGGVGLLCAHHLAKHYRAKLALVGRSQPTPAIEAQLAELANAGAEVCYIRADIGATQQAHAAIAQAKAQFGQIHGIIHSAGVLHDQPLRNARRAEIEAVLHPKVYGTAALDQATASENLDFLALFSSITTVVGNFGQTAYGYANGFLDQFAMQRERLRQAGQRFGRTVSINWPYWQAGGMRMSAQAEQLMETLIGAMPLETSSAIEALYHALTAPASQIVVFAGDRSTFEAAMGTRLYQPSIRSEAMSYPSPIITESNPFSRQIQADLLRMAADILRARPEDIDPQIELTEFGLDSISMMEFANHINKQFKLKVTPTLFLEHLTLASVANYLAQQARPTDQAIPPMPEVVARTATKVETPISKPIAPVVIAQPLPAPTLSQSINTFVAQPVVPQPKNQPIAVIGMSGRFPQADDLNEFWELLRSGTSAISEIPSDRWNWQEYHGDSRLDSSKTSVKWGGFLRDIAGFDAAFFNISPTEAQLMDPQQRLFLETVWQTIEDAGYRPSAFNGSRTAVFVGAFTKDYAELLQAHGINAAHTTTGTDHSIIANRVSYFFDWRGPSEAIDTACSSAFVAIHRAVQALRNGEADLAIAGGVNALLAPQGFLRSTQAGMLSQSGTIRSFDQSADGYLRGEGVGAVLLKPLAQAERDGDIIHGVIRGSAVNHNGRSYSLTAPNPAAQTDVIIRAYANAEIDPASVSYIEAHGTGTVIGDPAEIQAFQRAFEQLAEQSSLPSNSCGIGSIKPNIGHLEAASGIAAFIKVLLALRHATIPATLNLETINPQIDLAETPFQLIRTAGPWQAQHGQRRASLHSFGFGGTNAHIVLDEYPQVRASAAAAKPVIVPCSAKHPKSLRAGLAALHQHVVNNPQLRLDDLAYTLQIGREAFDERVAFVVQSNAELITLLESYLNNTITPDQAIYVGSMQHNDRTLKTILAGKLGQSLLQELHTPQELSQIALLWTKGVDVAWEQLDQTERRQRLALPTYRFNHQSYWIPTNPDDHNPSNNGDPEASNPAPKPEHAPTSVIGQLQQLFSQVLGISAEQLDPYGNLEAYGLDSILATKARYLIEQRFGINVPMNIFKQQEHIAALAQQIPADASFAEDLETESVEALKVGTTFGLSAVQEAFVVGQHLLPFDHLGCHFFLTFPLTTTDPQTVAAAWLTLCQRHPMLTMQLVPPAAQTIRDPRDLPAPTIRDCTSADDATIAAACAEHTDRLSHAAYPLDAWPRWSLQILALPHHACRVFLSVDETLLDAASLVILLHEWHTLVLDPATVLPPASTAFPAFLQRLQTRAAAAAAADLAYWRTRLHGITGGPALPWIPLQPHHATTAPDGRRFLPRTRLAACLPAPAWSALQALAQQHAVAPSTLLLAVFAHILRSATADPRAPFALILTLANRVPLIPASEQLVAPVVSTTLVRLDPADSLATLLPSLQAQLWDTLDHPFTSGIAVLRDLKHQQLLPATTTIPVVFTAMLNAFGNHAQQPSFFPAVDTALTQTPNVWLDHQLLERNGALHFNWDILPAAFPRGLAEALFSRYTAALQTLACDPAALHAAALGLPDPTPLPLSAVQRSYLLARPAAPARFYQEFRLPQHAIPRLAAAWLRVAAAHPGLRMTLHTDHLVCASASPTPLDLPITPERGPAAITATRTAMQHAPLQPIAVRLTHDTDATTVLHCAIDALYLDGRSLMTLFREWAACAAAPFAPFAPPATSPHALRAALAAATSPTAADWATVWADRPLGPTLPSGTAQAARYNVPIVQPHALAQAAAAHGLSLNTLLLTSFAAVLAAWLPATPWSLTVVSWDRPTTLPDAHRVIGDFTALRWLTLPLPAADWTTAAHAVAAALAADAARPGDPIAALRPRLRHASQQTPFPLVFTELLDYDPSSWAVGAGWSQTPGVAIDCLPQWTTTDTLLLQWDVAAQISDPQTLQQLLATQAAWLDRLATDPTAWTLLVPTSLPAGAPSTNHAQLLPALATAVNHTPSAAAPAPQVAWTEHRSVPAVIAAVAHATPHAIALSFRDAHCSYADLETRATALAHTLIAAGAAPGQLIGLLAHRSLDLPIAILAILKTGAAYLPLDPHAPADRLTFILHDAQVALILHDPTIDSTPFAAPQRTFVPIHTTPSPSSTPLPRIDPTADAYVIYTSGSTGQPKGVPITHRHILRLLSTTHPWFRFQPTDVWTLFHSVAFDFSVWELFGALCHGARLVIVPAAITRDFPAFYRLVAAEGVTILNQTPTAFAQFAAADAHHPLPLALRTIVFGGEALDLRLLAPWFDRHGDQQPQLINMYGITETTVHVTYRPITTADLAHARSVIGVPLPDLQLAVWQPDGSPTPVGEVGELVVFGAGVSRGYLRRPALTAQKFVTDPHRGSGYRSGDLVRVLPDGDLEYLGRNDLQVKVRGFRIELGDIEAALRRDPAVAAAVATVVRTGVAEPTLVGYLVPHPGATIDLPRLRAQAATWLPPYMVPSVLGILPAVPLTVNGKLDRRALPWPLPTTPTSAAPSEVAPHPDVAAITATISGLVTTLLHGTRVAPTADLFSAGATSLTIVTLVQQLADLYPVSVPIAQILEFPTISAIAAWLAAQLPAPAPVTTPAMAVAPQPELAAITATVSGLVTTLLHGTPVAPTADLFSAGATSLTIVTLVQQLADHYPVSVPIAQILEFPTISAIAAWLATQLSAAQPAASPTAPPIPAASIKLAVAPNSELFGATWNTNVKANQPINLTQIAGLLSTIQRLEIAGEAKYLHASAGGKYAIQVYLAVRAGGIEGLAAGCYYYHPEEQALILLSTEIPAMPTAPFMLILAGHLNILRPIYQDGSPVFGLLDAGYLSQVLRSRSGNHGIGLTPWVDLDQTAIRHACQLDADDQIALCFGGGNLAATAQPTQIIPHQYGGATVTTAEIAALSGPMKYHQTDASTALAEPKRMHAIRNFPTEQARQILPTFKYAPEEYLVRTCQRRYEARPVAFNDFSRFLSFLQPDSTKLDHLTLEALEAITIYLSINQQGVIGVDAGIYRYDRASHSLIAINDQFSYPLQSCHIPFNRQQLSQAAFCGYFVIDSHALPSHYAATSALIAAGALSQYLLEQQSKVNIGMVPIGGLHFERVKQDFGLTEQHVLLHSFIAGAFTHQVQRSESTQFAQQPVILTKPQTSNGLAIVGYSGLYPGASNLEQFWVNLASGTSTISLPPSERWSLEQGFDQDQRAGKIYSWAGGYLENIMQFDHLLFNISPLEARSLDPQERLLLQAVWECLEQAGYTNESLLDDAPRVGVFVGAMWNDYQLQGLEGWQASHKAATAALHSSLANRISHYFNFNGPSMAVNTSCSSAITALHLAAESIQRGECDAAIVGGVNLILHPYHHAALCAMNLVATDGHSRAFSAQGTGLVPGEGVGALLIRPVAQAQANNTIHGIIRSTAISHYGRTNQFGMANTKSQTQLILQAFERAKLRPQTVNYIEAAATGSALADASEIAALSNTFKHYGATTNSLIGSIKPNIGHLEAASGLSQITKVLLQLKHRRLAPSINYEPINPLLQLETSPFTIVHDQQDWVTTRDDHGVIQPRRALINAFGATGSGGCVIIEEYCDEE